MSYSKLIFSPYRRTEVWRFVSYQFLHANFNHIAGNIMGQLLLGIPLEMLHGTFKIALLYTVGKHVSKVQKLIAETRSFNGLTFFVGYCSSCFTTWCFWWRFLHILCSFSEHNFKLGEYALYQSNYFVAIRVVSELISTLTAEKTIPETWLKLDLLEVLKWSPLSLAQRPLFHGLLISVEH